MENKFFKRTLLGAAIATVAVAGSANAYEIGENNDFGVEVYGVAAISWVHYDIDKKNEKTGVKTDGTTGYDYENESRIGFRAGKEMFDNLEVFMQVESGYVGEDGKGSTFGGRDTFIGLGGDWGKVRFGRMLTPMYEIIDWPYANPGLGASWDWGGDVKYNYDRKGDMARYDSPAFGDFTFSLATGRGDTGTEGSNFSGASAHYRLAEVVTFHAGVEAGSKYNGTDADTFGYLLGFEASLPAGFGISGAWKSGESEEGSVTSSQDSYSVIGQYWNGPWGVKVGYTANLESDVDGDKQDDADSVVSGQLMYVHNGFVPYVRIANRDIRAVDAGDMIQSDIFVVRVGIEYGF
ncbi:porin [Aliivibrio salmonicida]|uniref:porin n=1 Tax=Aliivibrio salmonicida TaxID=40269 RepID=UPI003D0F7ACE